MSGAAIYTEAPDNKLYLFGAVQQVPASFSGGMLEVARVSDAQVDAELASHLQAAPGFEVPVLRWDQFAGFPLPSKKRAGASAPRPRRATQES